MKSVHVFHLHSHGLLRGCSWLSHLGQTLSSSQRAALPGRSSQCHIPHRVPLFLQVRRGEIPKQNLQTCQSLKGRNDQFGNGKNTANVGGSRQLSRADVRVCLETVQVTPEAVE